MINGYMGRIGPFSLLLFAVSPAWAITSPLR
jgi:hypothetical protein